MPCQRRSHSARDPHGERQPTAASGNRCSQLIGQRIESRQIDGAGEKDVRSLLPALAETRGNDAALAAQWLAQA